MRSALTGDINPITRSTGIPSAASNPLHIELGRPQLCLMPFKRGYEEIATPRPKLVLPSRSRSKTITDVTASKPYVSAKRVAFRKSPLAVC
jgi:hypothetical protein